MSLTNTLSFFVLSISLAYPLPSLSHTDRQKQLQVKINMSTPYEARESVCKKDGGKVKETDRCKLTFVHHHIPEQILHKYFLRIEPCPERERVENRMGQEKKKHTVGKWKKK